MAMLKHPEKIIFEYSRPTRGAYGQWPTGQRAPNAVASDIPENLRRKKAPGRGDSPEGVLIGTRSRTLAGEGSRIDAESWMFCTIASASWCFSRSWKAAKAKSAAAPASSAAWMIRVDEPMCVPSPWCR